MKLKLIKILRCISVTGLIVTSINLFIPSPKAQTIKEQEDWYEKLLEKDVKYEDFACSKGYVETVEDYFQKRKPNKLFPVCHNDCPIVVCRPIVPYPVAAKLARIGGTVSTHILVNDEGRTIYARVLTGHPLLRKNVRKAACQTQFNIREGLHQGVMHFQLNPDSDEIDIPRLANVVLKPKKQD
jgi:hypothetical protein